VYINGKTADVNKCDFVTHILLPTVNDYYSVYITTLQLHYTALHYSTFQFLLNLLNCLISHYQANCIFIYTDFTSVCSGVPLSKLHLKTKKNKMAVTEAVYKTRPDFTAIQESMNVSNV